MILLAIHTMRKRGLTLAEVVKQGRYQVTRRGPPPPPKKNESTWDSKPGFGGEYGSMRSNTVTPPPVAALVRSGSNSSQRPLMALNRSERCVTSSRLPDLYARDIAFIRPLVVSFPYALHI